MPKRTNLFQEVDEILHRQMAGDATVEASAELPSQSTGEPRGYGEGMVAGRDALLVVSEPDEGEAFITIRIRPLDSSNAE